MTCIAQKFVSPAFSLSLNLWVLMLENPCLLCAFESSPQIFYLRKLKKRKENFTKIMEVRCQISENI